MFVDGNPVDTVVSCVDADADADADAGAGWVWEDWCEHRDEMLAKASPAVREVLLEVLDGPPGGVYVEGREDRP
ncbi:hypothetical protein [Rhodococcus wratislaviensis]|uniref:hypothetical protein n=1 Tax=Rhodococcus wratislaviensis TaxID=44752 RepID=UPI0035163F61